PSRSSGITGGRHDAGAVARAATQGLPYQRVRDSRRVDRPVQRPGAMVAEPGRPDPCRQDGLDRSLVHPDRPQLVLRLLPARLLCGGVDPGVADRAGDPGHDLALGRVAETAPGRAAAEQREGRVSRRPIPAPMWNAKMTDGPW